MSDDQDPASFERYFRPRGAGDPPPPAPSAHGSGGVSFDDELPDAVSIGDVPAPRVPVSGGHRRTAGGTSRAGRRGAADARRQRRFLMVTGVMSAFVLLTAGGAWAFESYVTGTVGKTDVAGLGKGAGDGPKGAMNILIAGVDRRQGLTKDQEDQLHLGHDQGARSDTMMLVHLSADHRRVSVISLPRDSYVLIPAHVSNGDEGPKGGQVPARYGKLTWTYEFGGPDLTVATIKKATGLSIDHYVEVNFFGFVKMVDAVGGVDLCVPQAINDAKSGLQLPAGRSHVNGIKALGFARARYTLGDGSDLGRIDRQQKFMATMLRTALSANTLTDPIKSASFLKASLDALTVDKGLARDLPALADQLKSLSTDSVEFAKIPLANQDFRTTLWNAGGLQSTVQWDQQGAAALFRGVRQDRPLAAPAAPAASASAGGGTASPAAPGLGPGNLTGASPKPGDPTVPASQITVRVRNGVGTAGLARKAAADLHRAGFATVVIPGTTGAGQPTTLIQYGRGRGDSAKTLAAALPGARLKEVDSLGTGIQVVVGADWAGAKKVKVVTPSLGATPGTAPAQAAAGDTRTATQNVLCK